MTGAHNFLVSLCTSHLWPPLQLRGMLRTLTLCLQFPIVTTILWGQLAGKTMTVLSRSLLLYCTAMFVYVYQTPTSPPHCGDNVKVKTQQIIFPSCSAVWVKQWLQMTGALSMMHFAWTFSSQPPKTHIDPKHKIWHPLIYCSTYFQAHSH